MIDASQANQAAGTITAWAVGLPSVGVIIAFGISLIRRRISADSKELLNDRTFNNMLDWTSNEKDKLEAEKTSLNLRITTLETEKNNALMQVATLRVQVDYLTVQVEELRESMREMKKLLEEERDKVQDLAIENAKLNSDVTRLTGSVHSEYSSSPAAGRRRRSDDYQATTTSRTKAKPKIPPENTDE